MSIDESVQHSDVEPTQATLKDDTSQYISSRRAGSERALVAPKALNGVPSRQLLGRKDFVSRNLSFPRMHSHRHARSIRRERAFLLGSLPCTFAKPVQVLPGDLPREQHLSSPSSRFPLPHNIPYVPRIVETKSAANPRATCGRLVCIPSPIFQLRE